MTSHVPTSVLVAIWQERYYERVLRTGREYLEIWRYIDENPLNWTEDEYHRKPGCLI